MEHKLPDLNYSYEALEPYIDAKTMKIHHSKHHQSYVENLNSALNNQSNLKDKSLEDLLSDFSSIPEEVRVAIRNNGGGHYNHSFFWKLMTPKSTEPPSELLVKIKAVFGDLEAFKTQFENIAMKRFGSGWAWLVDNNGSLELTSTPNQESPIMQGMKPLLGLDVWEHAYYLKYQNRRADYIQNWWNIVDWNQVEANLKSK